MDRRLPARGLAGIALLSALPLLAACEGNYQLVISYPDQDSFDRARRVELFVASEVSCEQLRQAPGAARLSFDPHGPLPELGDLALGATAFFATARDADCLTFLDGCREYELQPRQDEVVRIGLLPVVEFGCPGGTSCVDLVCVATDAAIGDAGADARVDAAASDRLVSDRAVRDQVGGDMAVPDTAVPDTAAPDTSPPDAMAPDAVATDSGGLDRLALDTAAGADREPRCGADLEPCCATDPVCVQGHCDDGRCVGWSTRFLSELRWVEETNGYGPVERDTSNGEDGLGDGVPISIHGAGYPRGLGMHADASIRLDLAGTSCTRLIADLGLDDEVLPLCTEGDVVFRVRVDSIEVFASGVVDSATATVQLDIDVSGASSVELIVDSADADSDCDHADWADARLICPSAVPTFGLVAELKLDDVSGAVAHDSSGNGNHGGLYGTPIWTGGVVDGALAFHYLDGTDAVVLPDNESTRDVQERDFTLAAWFRPASVPPALDVTYNDYAYVIVGKGGWHTCLEYSQDKTYEVEHFSNAEAPLGVGTSWTYASGTWRHVAAAVDRAVGTTRLYVDGQPDGEVTWASGTPSHDYGTACWHVGTSEVGKPTYRYDADGAVDAVRIYRRALTDEEIAVLAAER
ncbi:MAG: NPCBM/NEW2 domain-containing protein [Deltaproteobacteria bacterium]|nr:NPCBM/NEW2 domain-containing protein [Deltaproteobacteria bacterium]